MTQETAPPRLGKNRVAPWLFRAALIALALSALATLAGRFGQLAWPLELASHFAVQLLAIQAIATALLVKAGRQRLAAAFLPFAVVNLLLIAPSLLAPAWRAEAAGGPTRLTVMAANLHFEQHRSDLLQAEIARIDPDVILLIEPVADYYGDNSPLRRTHPYVIFHKDGAGTGLMMASRIPWERATTLTLSTTYSPSIYATFCPTPERGPAGCADVLGVHPISPLGAKRSQMRDAELRAIAEFVASRQPERFVVMGDFNTTPWSVRFSEFLDRSRLSDAPAGRGLAATWLSKNPLLGLPIDHILVGRDIQVLDQEVGADIGAEHYPISAQLAF
jgi:endonuclease/exonuclease/phosphatase (EEP) superfamily protein YafD